MTTKLWEKFEDDFKLEYMDLDEFLTENDLPIETVLHEHLLDPDQKLQKDPIHQQQHKNNQQLQLSTICDLHNPTSLESEISSMPEPNLPLSIPHQTIHPDTTKIKIETSYSAISQGQQHHPLPSMTIVTSAFTSQKPLLLFPDTYQTQSIADTGLQVDQNLIMSTSCASRDDEVSKYSQILDGGGRLI